MYNSETRGGGVKRQRDTERDQNLQMNMVNKPTIHFLSSMIFRVFNI